MLLKNAYSLIEDKVTHITINSGNNDASITFTDAFSFPGLVNSHDHFDFNLFPKLGNRIYNNYVEWGDDIHKQNKEIINKVLNVPVELRAQWGIYKNLLNGITTVVNHGPQLQINNSPITIRQCKNVLHSVQLEKNWRLKLNSPVAANEPFVVHIGEGTDEPTRKEVDTLIKWNLFRRDMIGIHGIAMEEEQAKHFKALIWCPDSNYFLIGKTASIDKLKESTTILFGTDSTVSTNWNIWEHLRLAREQKMVSDNELFDMLTTNPDKIWGTNNSQDVVIAKRKQGLSNMDALFALNPEDILMVIHGGGIKLFDEALYGQLANASFDLKNFSKVYVNNNCKYVIGDLPGLIQDIKKYYPEADLPVRV